MKKRRKVIFGILIIIIPLSIAVYFSVFNTTHLTSVVIEEDTVDNCFNNANANYTSYLAKNGDKLYYSYLKDVFKYGTYQITAGKIKRVYGGGFAITPDILSLNNMFDGKILSTYLNKDNAIEYFNINDGKYEPYTTINENKNFNSCFVANENLYLYTDYGTDYACVYKYKDKKLEMVFSKEHLNLTDETCSNLYFYNNYIYFYDYKDDKIRINKYDMIKKEIVSYIDFNEELGPSNNLIAFENKVYFTGLDGDNYCVYKVDMKNKKIKKIFSTSASLIINGYDEKIYIGVGVGIQNKNESGVYSVSTGDDSVTKICEGTGVCEIYIVDTKWVYFTDSLNRLYRVTVDGKTIEKVFE